MTKMTDAELLALFDQHDEEWTDVWNNLPKIKGAVLRLRADRDALRERLETARYILAHYLEGDDILVDAGLFVARYDAPLPPEEKS